jgi:hypothetical protein
VHSLLLREDLLSKLHERGMDLIWVLQVERQLQTRNAGRTDVQHQAAIVHRSSGGWQIEVVRYPPGRPTNETDEDT